MSQSHLIFGILLALPLIWLSITDVTHHTIPDVASASVGVLGVAFGWFFSSLSGVDLVGALLLLLFLWGLSEAFWRRYAKDALGMGDVKLLAAGMLCTGVIFFWTAVLIAALGGICAVGIGRVLFDRDETGIPFGPFIAYGLYLTVTILRSPW